MPKVSVIIPTYNQATFLREAVDSVLQQSFGDFEVIIVDDGSSDETPDVAQSINDHRVIYHRQENRGLAGARNSGVALSTGEYLAFLDSDDLLLPKKIATQVTALEDQPAIGLVASGWEYITENGLPLGMGKPWVGRAAPDLESILIGGLTVVHAVLLRRTWFERVGGFDPSFRMAEDMDFWYRLGLAGCPMMWVPAIVCQYRIHGANMSRAVIWHFDALRRALDRLFAHPDLPVTLRGRRNSIFAEVRLAEAGRLYGIGDVEEAKGALRKALILDPMLCSETNDKLADLIGSWPQDVWAGNSTDMLDRVFANLPSEPALPLRLRRRIELTSAKAGFYQAFSTNNAVQIRRLWMKVALSEPSWLLNRGGWAILLKSFKQLPSRRATRVIEPYDI